MSSGLVVAVKKAALDAIENAKMCDLRYGTVDSTSPLKIKVTNQFTIPSSLLIVPEHLTNREVAVVIDNVTRTMTIRNELKVGDKVALLRKQGGQSYFILDRI